MSQILLEILERGDFSDATRKTYAHAIKLWTEFAGDNPKKWTPLTAQRFYDEMLKRGVQVNSANKYIGSLRYVSQWYAKLYSAQDFMIVQTKSSRIALKEDGADDVRRALTREEAEWLIGACDGDRLSDLRDAMLIIVGLETGMRRKSLVGMDFKNISDRHGYPTIRVPIKRSGGWETFEVPLSDTAALAIESWRRRAELRPTGPILRGIKRRLHSRGHTYEVLRGGLTDGAVYKAITTRATKAGLIDVHPHILRHTFITWRMQMGHDPVRIAAITGHRWYGREWQNMSSYIDLASIAREVRQSTPAWLVELARKRFA